MNLWDAAIAYKISKQRLAGIPFADIIQIRFPGIISAALQQHPDAILSKVIALFH